MRIAKPDAFNLQYNVDFGPIVTHNCIGRYEEFHRKMGYIHFGQFEIFEI